MLRLNCLLKHFLLKDALKEVNMKFEQLKSQSVDELDALLVEAKKDMFNFRFKRWSAEVTDTSVNKKKRKLVARIMTLQNQKNRGN